VRWGWGDGTSALGCPRNTLTHTNRGCGATVATRGPRLSRSAGNEVRHQQVVLSKLGANLNSLPYATHLRHDGRIHCSILDVSVAGIRCLHRRLNGLLQLEQFCSIYRTKIDTQQAYAEAFRF